MDATCTIQDSIHVFSLVHKYVSRILGTYHLVTPTGLLFLCAGSRVEKSRLKPGATRAARRRGTLLLDFDLLYLIR